MNKTFQKTLVAVAAGSVLAIASQSAMAAANLLPAIKVGGGWVSVVSHISTANFNGGSNVHATHQSKNMANLDDACVHLDGRSPTTLNDLTTSVLATPGGAVGSVFPVGDNVGGAIINPGVLPGVASSEGFMVLENYNSTGTTRGPRGTLTTDALVFNLASGFLFSSRGLEVTVVSGIAPNSDISIESPGAGGLDNLGLNTVTATGVNNSLDVNGTLNNTGRGLTAIAPANGVAVDGVLTRFAFLPPAAPAKTGAYVIPTNRRLDVASAGADDPLTTNLTAAGYRARATFSARMDLAQNFALGIYDRLENNRSLAVVNPVTCVGQLSPEQITGASIPTFIANGGWFNLATEAMTNGAGTLNVSDSATLYKVEFAPGYGLSITPLNQQFYAK